MIHRIHHGCTSEIKFGVSCDVFCDSVFCFPHIVVAQIETPELMGQAGVLARFQEAPGVGQVQGNVYSCLSTFC